MWLFGGEENKGQQENEEPHDVQEERNVVIDQLARFRMLRSNVDIWWEQWEFADRHLAGGDISFDMIHRMKTVRRSMRNRSIGDKWFWLFHTFYNNNSFDDVYQLATSDTALERGIVEFEKLARKSENISLDFEPIIVPQEECAEQLEKSFGMDLTKIVPVRLIITFPTNEDVLKAVELIVSHFQYTQAMAESMVDWCFENPGDRGSHPPMVIIGVRVYGVTWGLEILTDPVDFAITDLGETVGARNRADRADSYLYYNYSLNDTVANIPLENKKEIDPTFFMDKTKRNALHIATFRNMPNDVKMILDHGGDPWLIDEDGRPPLYYSKMLNHDSCTDLLINFMVLTKDLSSQDHSGIWGLLTLGEDFPQEIIPKDFRGACTMRVQEMVKTFDLEEVWCIIETYPVKLTVDFLQPLVRKVIFKENGKELITVMRLFPDGSMIDLSSLPVTGDEFRKIMEGCTLAVTFSMTRINFSHTIVGHAKNVRVGNEANMISNAPQPVGDNSKANEENSTNLHRNSYGLATLLAISPNLIKLDLSNASLGNTFVAHLQMITKQRVQYLDLSFNKFGSQSRSGIFVGQLLNAWRHLKYLSLRHIDGKLNFIYDLKSTWKLLEAPVDPSHTDGIVEDDPLASPRSSHSRSTGNRKKMQYISIDFSGNPNFIGATLAREAMARIIAVCKDVKLEEMNLDSDSLVDVLNMLPPTFLKSSYNVNHNPLGNGNAKFLTDIFTRAGVRQLALNGCNMLGRQFDQLESEEKYMLERLYLSHNTRFAQAGAGAKGLATFPALRSLSLAFCGINPDFLDSLAQNLQPGCKIREFAIGGNPLLGSSEKAGACLGQILKKCKVGPEGLKYLSLADSEITSAFLRGFVEDKSAIMTIHKLDLSGNTGICFYDELAESYDPVIDELFSSIPIEELYLHDCDLDPAFLAKIGQSLIAIKRIYLDRNKKLGAKQGVATVTGLFKQVPSMKYASMRNCDMVSDFENMFMEIETFGGFVNHRNNPISHDISSR